MDDCKNHIEKICPVCNIEIKEGEPIKVCPECGSPHHEACWEKNQGCATDGCKMQHKISSKSICPKCGANLEEGQLFCPKCGTAKGTPAKSVCSKCGANLEEGQLFCPKCGQKVGLEGATDTTLNSDRKSKANNPSKGKKSIIAVIAIVLVIICAVIAIPKIFVSPDKLCEQGKFEEAYGRASKDKKNEILAKNRVAYLSQQTSNYLKNPSSFILREAYVVLSYKENRIYQHVILNVSGQNGFGGNTTSYWLWGADEDGTFDYLGGCDKLNVKDDDDDFLAAVIIKGLMERDYAISLDQKTIDEINKAFQENQLKQVNLIDIKDIDVSILHQDGQQA